MEKFYLLHKNIRAIVYWLQIRAITSCYIAQFSKSGFATQNLHCIHSIESSANNGPTFVTHNGFQDWFGIKNIFRSIKTWQLNIFYRCGGSLVSRRHVVTAGHCVARATPKQVHVTLGDYVINSAVEPLPAYTFGVSQIQVNLLFSRLE